MHKCQLATNMSPINLEYFAILIYRLKLSEKAVHWQVLYGFHINYDGSVYFHYKTIVGGTIINTPLVSSDCLTIYNARL